MKRQWKVGTQCNCCCYFDKFCYHSEGNQCERDVVRKYVNYNSDKEREKDWEEITASQKYVTDSWSEEFFEFFRL